MSSQVRQGRSCRTAILLPRSLAVPMLTARSPCVVSGARCPIGVGSAGCAESVLVSRIGQCIFPRGRMGWPRLALSCTRSRLDEAGTVQSCPREPHWDTLDCIWVAPWLPMGDSGCAAQTNQVIGRPQLAPGGSRRPCKVVEKVVCH